MPRSHLVLLIELQLQKLSTSKHVGGIGLLISKVVRVINSARAATNKYVFFEPKSFSILYLQPFGDVKVGVSGRYVVEFF